MCTHAHVDKCSIDSVVPVCSPCALHGMDIYRLFLTAMFVLQVIENYAMQISVIAGELC